MTATSMTPNSRAWANGFWRLIVSVHEKSAACRERAARREAKGDVK